MADLEPHPWSRDFTWQDARGPFRRVTASQARRWNEEGFFLLESAFDAETLRRVVAEIDPWEARVEAALRQQEGGRIFIARAGEITFTTHLVARSETLRRFCAGPAFRDLAHDLVGPDVRLYWDQAVYKKPGAPSPFPWHQDNGYAFIEPQQYLTCWVALSDASEAHGAPWVVPGLHRQGTLRHREGELGLVCFEEPPAEAVCVPARAGDVVVFSSLTPHATGPNTTSEVRKAYIVQFAPDGAVVRRDDGRRAPADDPERQFPVLVGGAPPA